MEVQFKEKRMKMKRNILAVGPKEMTRRQMLAGGVIGLGGLAFGAGGAGAAGEQEMAKTPRSEANKLRTTIHQEVDFHAAPERIYNALLDAKQFAALTSLAAEIHREAGGQFSTFGGIIVGRNLELLANQRIVQAWRVSYWEPGAYSIVKFELKAQGAGTKVILDHRGFPDGEFESLDAGWKPRYWEPLAKYLAQNA
jgi:activator of HSP90 ATPase